MGKSVSRLAETFQPENYKLSIEIDAENMVFSGSVTIRGKKTGRPSKRITLHQKDLKITSAKITKHAKDSEEAVSISRVNLHKTFDEVRLHSNSLLYPGQ